MSDYRVTYFTLSGSRGEEVRLALALAGVPFDDNRMEREAWLAMKPDSPYGSLPVLDIEGHGAFGQTNAILRLVGRLHGLHPEEPFEAARHDALLEAGEDLRHKISATMRLADADEKKAARQKLSDETIPQWGRSVERQIGTGPFFVGDKASVADIKVYMMDRWIVSGIVDDLATDALDPFPKLKTLCAAVAAHPAVVAWYGQG